MQIDDRTSDAQGDPDRLAIVAASEPEAAWVRRHINVVAKSTQAVGALWYGRWHGQEVILLRCGMGPERAAAGLSWLRLHHRLWGVISVGFAGGLQRQLATGDAVLATCIQSPEKAVGQHAKKIRPDCRLAQLAAAAVENRSLNHHRGPLLSQAELVPFAPDKQTLGKQTGALAIDMESYSLGCVAVSYHLPFVSLRTIFDTCHEDLAFSAEVATTADGRLRFGGLMQYLLVHPRAWLALPHLWSSARVAGNRLSVWLDQFFALLAALSEAEPARRCGDQRPTCGRKLGSLTL